MPRFNLVIPNTCESGKCGLSEVETDRQIEKQWIYIDRWLDREIDRERDEI
jgi:hypothetical protein